MGTPLSLHRALFLRLREVCKSLAFMPSDAGLQAKFLADWHEIEPGVDREAERIEQERE